MKEVELVNRLYCGLFVNIMLAWLWLWSINIEYKELCKFCLEVTMFQENFDAFLTMEEWYTTYNSQNKWTKILQSELDNYKR